MTIDELIRLIEAVTKLLGVLVWPFLLLYVLVRYGRGARCVCGQPGRVHAEGRRIRGVGQEAAGGGGGGIGGGGGFETGGGCKSGRKCQRRACCCRRRGGSRHASGVETDRRLHRLWVDDRPSNNVHERQALEALGCRFVLATSTEDALEKLKQNRVDAIISDMGRPPDPQAGYTLLDRLRTAGDQTPFIIYASSRAPEHRAEARRRGAVGTTNRPDELFEMVLSVLGRAA